MSQLRLVCDMLGQLPNSGEEILALVREAGGDDEVWEAGLRRLARRDVAEVLSLLEVYVATVRQRHGPRPDEEEWETEDYEALAVLVRRLAAATEVAAIPPERR